MDNCIDGKEISSKCSFEIRIKPPLTKSLNCTLKFNDASNEIIFSSIKCSVKAQENNKCPFFSLDIYERNKRAKVIHLKDLSIYDIYQLFAMCGGSFDPFNKTFLNVSHADLIYSNKDLNDQETNFEMNLCLSGMFL